VLQCWSVYLVPLNMVVLITVVHNPEDASSTYYATPVSHTFWVIVYMGNTLSISIVFFSVCLFKTITRDVLWFLLWHYQFTTVSGHWSCVSIFCCYLYFFWYNSDTFIHLTGKVGSTWSQVDIIGINLMPRWLSLISTFRSGSYVHVQVFGISYYQQL
jgi:hypothetical protein